MLVHEEYKSTRIEQICDPDCESICVKIELLPTPLVNYLAYVNDSKNRDILMKHHNLVHQVTLMETESRIAVLGDFNFHSIVWNFDDTEAYFLPQNLASHMESEYFQTALEFLQRMQEHHELEVKGSAVSDNISPIVIKKCADVLVWPLWILHQKSMKLGKISTKLKISRVVPVFKKKGKRWTLRTTVSPQFLQS